MSAPMLRGRGMMRRFIPRSRPRLAMVCPRRRTTNMLRRHLTPSRGRRRRQWLHRGTGAHTRPACTSRTPRSRRSPRTPGAIPHGTAVSGGGDTGDNTRWNRAACPMGVGEGPLAPPSARTLCETRMVHAAVSRI